MKRSLVLACALTSACSPPPAAPEDLDALTAFLFREWDNADPAVLVDGVKKLEETLAVLDLKGSVAGRSFALTSLAKADVSTVDAPADADPANTIGTSLAGESEWPVTDHARLQAEGKLLEAEPSAKAYERKFLTDTPTCFIDRGCGLMKTENTITRSNLLMEVTLTIFRNFKWITLPDGRFAVLSRAWANKSWPATNPDKGVAQTYTVEAWIGTADNKTWRYQATWSESKPAYDKDTTQAVVSGGMDDTFTATNEVIGTRFHGK